MAEGAGGLHADVGDLPSWRARGEARQTPDLVLNSDHSMNTGNNQIVGATRPLLFFYLIEESKATLVSGKVLFSSPKKLKTFQDSLSHRILRHMH